MHAPPCSSARPSAATAWFCPAHINLKLLEANPWAHSLCGHRQRSLLEEPREDPLQRAPHPCLPPRVLPILRVSVQLGTHGGRYLRVSHPHAVHPAAAAAPRLLRRRKAVGLRAAGRRRALRPREGGDGGGAVSVAARVSLAGTAGSTRAPPRACAGAQRAGASLQLRHFATFRRACRTSTTCSSSMSCSWSRLVTRSPLDARYMLSIAASLSLVLTCVQRCGASAARGQ